MGLERLLSVITDRLDHFLRLFRLQSDQRYLHTGVYKQAADRGGSGRQFVFNSLCYRIWWTAAREIASAVDIEPPAILASTTMSFTVQLLSSFRWLSLLTPVAAQAEKERHFSLHDGADCGDDNA